ncbi:MAG: hypothetical protein ACKOQ3_03555 [Novosphingobium sp.]
MNNASNPSLADLINSAMDLPIDWAYSELDTEIPADVLLEFSKLSREIVSRTMDRKFHAAISFLWKTRNYVGITHFNNDDFIGTVITESESKRIALAIEWSLREASNVLAPKACKSPNLSALLLNTDRDEIVEVFLRKERIILREFGLNQSSVEIVINRLRGYKLSALLNINHGGGLINSNSISKACAALHTISRASVSINSSGLAGRKARSSRRNRLRDSKDKIVGIATLFGDAAPLLFGAQLDVTSYLSTAFGATAMALLPRGAVTG